MVCCNFWLLLLIAGLSANHFFNSCCTRMLSLVTWWCTLVYCVFTLVDCIVSVHWLRRDYFLHYGIWSHMRTGFQNMGMFASFTFLFFRLSRMGGGLEVKCFLPGCMFVFCSSIAKLVNKVIWKWMNQFFWQMAEVVYGARTWNNEFWGSGRQRSRSHDAIVRFWGLAAASVSTHSVK